MTVRLESFILRTNGSDRKEGQTDDCLLHAPLPYRRDNTTTKIHSVYSKFPIILWIPLNGLVMYLADKHVVPLSCGFLVASSRTTRGPLVFTNFIGECVLSRSDDAHEDADAVVPWHRDAGQRTVGGPLCPFGDYCPEIVVWYDRWP